MHVRYWYGANAAKGVHFLRDPITPQQQYWYLAGTNTVVPLGSAVREPGSMNSSKATCSLFLMQFWKTKVEKSFRKWFSKQGMCLPIFQVIGVDTNKHSCENSGISAILLFKLKACLH